jgi:hypothetical protein
MTAADAAGDVVGTGAAVEATQLSDDTRGVHRDKRNGGIATNR